MIGILLVSHSQFAQGLKDAAEMIIGPQEGLEALGMQSDANLDVLQEEITQRVRAMQAQGEALILADLAGGSPCNSCAHLALEGVPVLGGVNLPILLEALLQRSSMDARTLSDALISSVGEGIVHVTRQLEAVRQASEKGE